DFIVRDLRLITVIRSEEKLQFSSSDGEGWQIADVSENFRIEKELFTAAIRSLSKLQSRTIVNEEAGDAQLSEYGLNPPEAVVKFKDREGNSTEVEIGMASPSGSGRYARKSGSKTIVLLPSYAVNTIFNTAADFRDMGLPTVNLEKLTFFEFRNNGKTFRMEPRTGDDHYTAMISPFVVTSPWKNHYALDDQSFHEALTEKTPLPYKVDAFLDNADPQDERFGLDENAADLLLLSDADGNTLNLIIGREDGQGNRYGRFGNYDDSIFLLNNSSLNIIKTDPFRFISKFVFLGSIFQVSQVKVERSGDTWLMKRTERGKPEDTDDDRFIVNNMEVPKKEFTSVYQKFIALMYEGEAVNSAALKTPEVRITISNVDSNIKPKIIRYWPYNDVYFQVSIDDNPIEFIVGRYQLDDFIEDLSALSEYGS
ncbi:MAG: DUF4340 domain-containing protein, partial [Spirochaetaceae bacterium]|nr:DUF4340 domain-containing protein [Spirochaetaceae bacterium]